MVLIRSQTSGQHLEAELEDLLTASSELLVYDTHIGTPLRWQSHIIFDRWKQAELAMHLLWVKLETV